MSLDNQQQQQLSVAEQVSVMIKGIPLTEMPKDLYIPPEALEVFLETFEGPLDLLLYLIKKQDIDILDIPIAKITEQYMEYVELMKSLNLELAAEYLVMAAFLAEIKSRMLLPKPASEENDEEDPRAELIRRLQEYERFKKAAEDLDQLPRMDRDYFAAEAEPPPLNIDRPLPAVRFDDLMQAFKQVMRQAELRSSHLITKEPLSIRERMSQILLRLSTHETEPYCEFRTFFKYNEGKMGVVVTFIAILELLKGQMIEMMQNKPFAPIYIRTYTSHT